MKTNPAWESCVPCTNLSPANQLKDFPKSMSCQAARVSFKETSDGVARIQTPGLISPSLSPVFHRKRPVFRQPPRASHSNAWGWR